MSSTRRSKDTTVFHQARYASSVEFERGLIANLVARRCTVLDDKSAREIVWFIQYLSHQAGGLAAVAGDLIARYTDRIQTPMMRKIALKPGKNYSSDQVKAIRQELPINEREQFLLKGEKGVLDTLLTGERVGPSDQRSFYRRMANESISLDRPEKDYPSVYPSHTFIDLCHSEAVVSLEKYLHEMCLNPEASLECGPWYFSSLIDTLREFQQDFTKAKGIGTHATALGKKVWEVLDYTVYCRGLTLVQGEARLGKSHAGRSWCQQHPGYARYVEVPSGNDEVTFFRDLARGLGLGNFLNYKVVQIRERVEYVLRTGDIILVLDEAQRLWPQTNFREGYPKRIAWVMTMANDGVPICMISTPQFFVTQKVVEKNGWNSAQLTGRISHFETLPTELSREDLMAVAKSVLPEANTQTLQVLAVYARSSARYLAAIDSIATRARYIASQDKRATATTEDVRKAMQESVIPADTKLHCALEAGRKDTSRKITPAPVRIAPEPLAASDPDPVTRIERGNLGVSGSRLAEDFKAPLIGV